MYTWDDKIMLNVCWNAPGQDSRRFSVVDLLLGFGQSFCWQVTQPGRLAKCRGCRKARLVGAGSSQKAMFFIGIMLTAAVYDKCTNT